MVSCVVVDLDIFHVDQVFSCRVLSVVRDESCFGILVYICSSSSLVISVSLGRRDCW